MAELSFIQTKKTVSDTLSDLRNIFKRYGIEEWEPMPIDGAAGYSVRYFRNRNWTEIKSTFQPTKAMNLRICYQVIYYMFSWESRGVSGIIKGTAFMGSDVAISSNNRQESFDEACAILGVEPGASLDEVEHTHRVKVQYSHPDKFTDPEEKKRATERFKRIENAYTLIKKVKASK